MSTILNNQSYTDLIKNLKQEISKARIRAHLAVNKELIVLYWNIGKLILERQNKEKWGSKVIQNISDDLRKEFPEMKGLSYQNLSYMRQFFVEYNNDQILQQAVGEIPWSHNIYIFSKLKNINQRIWYAQQTIENGWSRNVLSLQIKSNLYERSAKGINNFSNTLPELQSDLARSIIKDPYNLEFLDIQGKIIERDLENKLINNIKNFLLELGQGFAFVGNQYHIELEGEDYYLDLVFYHIKLKCYVVIELKTGKFKAEYAGKLNFYLNLMDHKIKDNSDNPTIGLILCEEKQGITVEYAIEGIQKPIGVSQFKLTETLPKKLEKFLPTPQELAKLKSE
ncbi:MAG: PDDEXK nuclease domain-containing protein [Rickettsia endosymbiont of Ecitomorpha arachnoides]|nr:PDDEXK nuclease domain-containing protein [Rickettsia endosymbiont of Ecitomorpha arachnoides]